MLVWLSMLTAVAVLWFVIPDSIGEKKKKLMFLTFSGIIVVFLVGGRCVERTAPPDVLAYYWIYEDAITRSIESVMRSNQTEWGYTVFNKILAFVIPWPQFIVYLEAAFVTLSVFRFLYINVKDVYFGVIVYFCTGAWAFMTSGFRQAFAIGICLFAYEFMKKRAFKSDLIALLLIFIAAMLHFSAWVFAVMFVIRNISVRPRVFLIGVGATFCTYFVLTAAVDLLVRITDDTLTSSGYEGSVFGGLVPIATFLVSLLLAYLANRSDKTFAKTFQMPILLVFFGLCLYTFRYNNTILERISYYFTIFNCVLLPSAIGAIKDYRTRNIVKALCIGVCFFLFVDRMAETNDYYFYWM